MSDKKFYQEVCKTMEYKEKIKQLKKENQKLKSVIDQAIQYIKEFSWYYAKDDGTKGFVIEEEKEETFVNELLKILGDKE